MESLRFFLVTRLLIFCHVLSGQPRVILDVSGIEPIIHEWNFATNTGNKESFERIYGDEVLFYSKTLSHDKAIREKLKRFRQSPELHHRIVGEIMYQPYTTGVIKCTFVTEISRDKQAETFNSYLLVTYRDGRYTITGESDEETDKKNKYKLDIGEPMLFVRENESDTLGNGTTSSDEASASLRDFDSLVTYLRSPQTIDVRRDRVFALIGMLLAGGLLIFVADKLGTMSGRRSARRNAIRESEFEQYKSQTEFQAFALTLFDPLYFRYRRLAHAGVDQASSLVQLIDFVFVRKDVEVTFLVQTIYRRNANGNDVYIVDPQARRKCAQMQKQAGKPMYFIVGVGGRPNDPHDIFLLPDTHVRESMTMTELMPYQKHGMFFWIAEKKILA